MVIEPSENLNSTVVLDKEPMQQNENLNSTVVIEKENREPIVEENDRFSSEMTRKATFNTTPQTSKAKVAKVSPMVAKGKK